MGRLIAAGLLAHQASVDRRFVHSVDKMRGWGYALKALFSPQHGFAGHTQANMIEVQSSWEKRYDVPLYSLYGEVRKPKPEMLDGLEAMVIDLQDVGARGYTFVWTLLYMLQACAAKGLRVVIIDRPNPIGGVEIEGPMLRPEFFSFVGLHAVPMRHGMTLGELALMMCAENQIDVKLQIKRAPGWKRRHYFEETGLPWVMPSPNVPTPTTTLLYPGMELLEGTNLSEGRGTTRPFEFFGAPYIDPHRLVTALNKMKLPGVYFRAASFEPTFDKWRGQLCHGAQIHITAPRAVRPIHTTAALLHTVIKHHGADFKFNNPPYEYEQRLMPFDILAGDSSLREALLAQTPLTKVVASWRRDCVAFAKRRKPFLLYS